MAELMRVASLTGYFQVMQEFGADPVPLLREVGLSRALLETPGQMVSARAAIRLLERSAEHTGCLTLGLRMAEVRALGDLGSTSLLLAHQPTLRLALEALVEFRNRVNSTLMFHFKESGEVAILGEDFSLSSPEQSRQASDLALGVLGRLCATVLGDEWAPLSVCFSHGAPPAAELPIFGRLFGCRPEFDSPVSGIVIDVRDLDRVNKRADTALAVHARQLIQSVMDADARTSAQEVEQLITLLLPSGRATIQTCATSLGVTVRTLQRMLDADGTSFSQLVNRTRMQLSAQYLSNPKVRITDVADMLGYGSIGAYTRWHTQIFGMSPQKWRKAAAADRKAGVGQA